jgi:hypothetical protein
MDRLLSGVEGVAIRSPIAAGAAAWRDRLVRAEQRREAEQPAAAACAPCVEDVGGVRSTCQTARRKWAHHAPRERGRLSRAQTAWYLKKSAGLCVHYCTGRFQRMNGKCSAVCSTSTWQNEHMIHQNECFMADSFSSTHKAYLH